MPVVTRSKARKAAQQATLAISKAFGKTKKKLKKNTKRKINVKINMTSTSEGEMTSTEDEITSGSAHPAPQLPPQLPPKLPPQIPSISNVQTPRNCTVAQRIISSFPARRILQPSMRTWYDRCISVMCGIETVLSCIGGMYVIYRVWCELANEDDERLEVRVLRRF